MEHSKLQLAEYPFQRRFFSCNGHNLHYLDEGEGEAVVMVHGNPSWSYYYRNLVTELSPMFRCIVPDHIGCGLSDKPDDSSYDYTLSSVLMIWTRCSAIWVSRIISLWCCTIGVA